MFDNAGEAEEEEEVEDAEVIVDKGALVPATARESRPKPCFVTPPSATAAASRSGAVVVVNNADVDDTCAAADVPAAAPLPPPACNSCDNLIAARSFICPTVVLSTRLNTMQVKCVRLSEYFAAGFAALLSVMGVEDSGVVAEAEEGEQEDVVNEEGSGSRVMTTTWSLTYVTGFVEGFDFAFFA